MNEIITCPNCQKKLQLPEEYLGKTVQCPGCKQTFTAQRAGVVPPPPTSPGREAPPPPKDDYEEEELPRRRRRRRADDDYEEDDYDDDDYDDRPRRRRRDLVPHRGGVILTLGILSLLICGPLGIAAWVMGNNDLAEIRGGRMDPEGEGTTQAGRICGMIATILMGLGLALACIIIALASMGRGRF